MADGRWQKENYYEKAALVFIDEYIHGGTCSLIEKAKALHMQYKIVHICTRPERLSLLQQHLEALGETVEVVMSLSGDLLRPAETFALKTRDEQCADVWILLGQTILKGEPEELHPTARAIKRQIQVHEGFTFVTVPWIVESN